MRMLSDFESPTQISLYLHKKTNISACGLKAAEGNNFLNINKAVFYIYIYINYVPHSLNADIKIITKGSIPIPVHITYSEIN